ncbi:MAG: porin [Mangrovibacterium sp.]
MRNYIYSIVCLCAALLCSSISSAQDKVKKPLGSGIVNFIDQDSTWSVKVSGMMQFLAATSINNNDGSHELASTFAPRRIRLKLGGFAYTPKLNYFLQLGFSEQDMVGINPDNSHNTELIYDAYIRWSFFRNCELKFGQFKLPGNAERMISSANMQFVDRSIMNSAMNIDRDMGLMLSHPFYLKNNFVVRDYWAFTQGEGEGVTNGNEGGYNYTARLELLPLGEFAGDGEYKGSAFGLEPRVKLMLGCTYNFNDEAIRTKGQLGKYMLIDDGADFHHSDMTNILLDAVLRYQRWSFLAEYGRRSANNPEAFNSDGSEAGFTVPEGNAYNVQGGFLFPSNWELSARYSEAYFKHNVYNGEAKRCGTVAISRYIVQHKLKVQGDFSHFSYGGGINSSLARLHFVLQF